MSNAMSHGRGNLVDLRSDTVTRPTAEMRAVMAQAEVGDDLYGEDPTVNRLQEQVAALLGKEAALFVPSGTMANQLALRVHTRPGDDVILSDGAHIKWYESGASAALAGVQLITLVPANDESRVKQDGFFSAADVTAAHLPLHADGSTAPITLMCVENTHNRGGGRVWPVAELHAVCEAARRLEMKTHLDGARLWNAAIALGIPPRDIATPFDTVSVCLSKGLGAPVGSLLAGSRAHIDVARRFRKMYGGAMRQSGIVAAAGIYALENHYKRLAVDHENARFLAQALRAAPSVRVALPVETNIVLFDLLPGAPDADSLTAALTPRGILIAPFGPRRIRVVTHLDVDKAGCARAVEEIREVLCRAL